nr:immunoglobulin heavy chain junction region [Macaca mulatta]MOX60493.1 immunoglobulin heavy chain junction region [Macaca mulatta]MOX63003.1 immunoglobulin heavy chain junction region [Macaca mulatta]MOX63293.1 immunoglobulin heavy chain junction region [Macaca mulatta]MOX65622.1 immunoglobulin heavy chain junction region [Macaca mulatta]
CARWGDSQSIYYFDYW